MAKKERAKVKDMTLINMAYNVAHNATCLRKKVGAVIASEGRIISTGYNGAPSGVAHCNHNNCKHDTPCERTVHAELNAIIFAAKYGISTLGATIYCTTEPCYNCSKTIINAGIKKVVYDEAYRDHSGIDLLKTWGIIVERLEYNGGNLNGQEKKTRATYGE